MPKSTKAKAKATVDKALEMFAENPSLTFTAVSRALEHEDSYVSKLYHRNSYGFKDRYDELLKQKFAELEAPAIVALGELIKDKQFNAVKYVLDNRGYKPVEKVEANITNDISITIGE